jgi:hypothetical protein
MRSFTGFAVKIFPIRTKSIVENKVRTILIV